MPNTPVRAAAEGLPKITRRLLLRTGVLAGAAVTPMVIPAAAESPSDRLRRLCQELQDALAEFCDGQFMAEIYPSNHPTESFAFHSADASPQETLARRRREVVAASKAVYPEVTDWRVLTPASPACEDSESMAGMFMIVGHRPKEVQS
ncbi:hypothetical protein [Mesorhizobium sp. YM1C-6-2]|uniref:hypothetical protein n=1 Tax=Mesorhizobium sp. YM1C-6-2 TaxID=1827501 RepID=UPI000EF193B3|nr:hypothetical protein [Mesorhizobium sp. YM1C-6-2]RLP22909.1 hypothetical protein D8676_21895 [Mesorhizobium sp. YM1C-6-2]